MENTKRIKKKNKLINTRKMTNTEGMYKWRSKEQMRNTTNTRRTTQLSSVFGMWADLISIVIFIHIIIVVFIINCFYCCPFIVLPLPNKSSPLDLIPTSTLKRFSHLFAPIISKLTNLSFSQAIFPASFKTPQVLPLLKKAV